MENKKKQSKNFILKTKKVTEIQDNLTNFKNFLLLHNLGLKVSDVWTIKKDLKSKNIGSIKNFKNSLLKIAANNLYKKEVDFENCFTGPNLTILFKDNEFSTLKEINTIIKKYKKKVKYNFGFFQNDSLNSEKFNKYINFHSKNDCLLITMNYLQYPLKVILNLLTEIVNKKK